MTYLEPLGLALAIMTILLIVWALVKWEQLFFRRKSVSKEQYSDNKKKRVTD